MALLKLLGLLLCLSIVQGRYTSRLKIDQRIVDGYPATEGQFPHVVHLHMEGPPGVEMCSGVLISNKHVLTAARCLFRYTTVQVRLGSISLSGGTVVQAESYTMHPLFNPLLLHNDIGIVFLPNEIEFTDLIKTIRLPKVSDDADHEGATALVSGWGALDDDENFPSSLQYVNLKVISNYRCHDIYGGVIINSTLCCEGSEKPSQSTCTGDKGSPLILQESDGEATLIGTASFISSAGCDSGYPSGYMRTSKFLSWISETAGIEIRP